MRKITRTVIIKILAITYFLLLLVILECKSDRILNPKGNLDWKTYTTADGLSYNLIYDLAVDSLDRIWIATLKGINVFDGVKWDTIDASDGLIFDNARVLHFDRQGNLWIGYGGNGNGLVKYDGTSFTRYTTADGLSDNSIESIASQSDGTIWVGTDAGGACKFDGNNWVCFDTNYVNFWQVWSVYVQNDSSIWFGTADGVTHYDGKSWTKYLRIFETEPNPLGYYYKQITAIGFDSRNTGWFGFAYGVYKYCNGEFHIDMIDYSEYVTISDIAEDKQGRVWLSSYAKGVYCNWNGTWYNYSVGQGLPDTYVTSVEVDSKGDVWFGTGEGLTRLSFK